ncbi:uncharacterized protein LOC129716832 [Wyeomyia smithii]|uniref:uncharacterized protein LOC129716832 n=1 Tax=Wyeomyia smithii TaxID=174621 RepID=UPI002467FE23|nr:uncharacterized protein LOC129716832 [Wyeomyia smithii]
MNSTMGDSEKNDSADDFRYLDSDSFFIEAPDEEIGDAEDLLCKSLGVDDRADDSLNEAKGVNAVRNGISRCVPLFSSASSLEKLPEDSLRQKCCMEVVFEEKNGHLVLTWSNTEPTFEDLGKFVYLQNQANRRRIDIDKVGSKQLISWCFKDKDIRVHVHIYSTAVSSKQLWELVEKQLIRHQDCDRAGAPNNQSLTALANQLRDIYGTHLTGHASSWKIWANYIHSTPAHERERRKNELPPQSIIKFFRSVPISEAVQLESTRIGLTVASTINQGYSSDLAILEDEVNEMIALGERIKHRLGAIRARCFINSGIVTALQDSVRPAEDNISRFLAENVTDMNDVDHL